MRPKNDVRYREVYTAKNPLHRGCVMRSWPSFYPFLRKVSAIKDISYKKVSLYSWSVTYSKLIAIYLFIFLTCLFTSYARTIHEKKIWTLEKKNMTHKMPTRKKFKASKYSPDKNLGPTKYSREKISDPRKHDGTRPMEFSTLYFIYMVGVVVKHIFTVVLSTIKINKFVHLC